MANSGKVQSYSVCVHLCPFVSHIRQTNTRCCTKTDAQTNWNKTIFCQFSDYSVRSSSKQAWLLILDNLGITKTLICLHADVLRTKSIVLSVHTVIVSSEWGTAPTASGPAATWYANVQLLPPSWDGCCSSVITDNYCFMGVRYKQFLQLESGK